ncbi:MAG TPA: septum formation initiator family protein [Actinomycetota bacterium]|nr:septum formation initiator family protein [Actinomycetota bacterium]
MSSSTRALSREGPRLTGRAAALLIVVAALTVLALVPARQVLGQRGKILDLERRAEQLESRNGELRAQITRLNDPAELERLARECLGMVMPGEIALVVPDSKPARC